MSSVSPEPSQRDVFLPAMALGDVLRDTALKMLRNWWILALCVGLSGLLSVFYVLTATPQYTANGALLIDPRVGQALDSRSNLPASIAGNDALTVDSELRVLTSREVTTQTMLALGIGAGETAATGGGGLRSLVSGLLGRGGDEDGAAPLLSAEQQLERRREAQRRQFVRGLKAQRAGDSYVIDIAYTSPDLALSAEAVNTLIEEYLKASGARQISEVERTRDWLSERINELEVEVRAAETAVAEFRGENELVTLQGELLPTEVALNAAIEGLIALRGEALVLDVRVVQLSEQIAAGDIDAIQLTLDERSTALDNFQSSYAELLREEQELLVSWTEQSPVVKAVRQQQEQLRVLMLEEYAKVRNRLAMRSEALARQVSATEEAIAELRAENGATARQTVELHNLEREAEAKRQLYQRLLEEYNNSSQLLTFDGTSARVIAWAVPPDRKSAPQSRQIVILAVFGGLVLAMAIVLTREALDGSFRNYAHLKSDLGVSFLGVVPDFASDQRGAGGLWATVSGTAPEAVPEGRLGGLSRAAQRLGFVTRMPASVSAETMRAIQVQLVMARNAGPGTGMGFDQPGLVVGVTSTLRGEGKTTTAFNLASFLARYEMRVAVVDGDLAAHQMSDLIDPILPETNRLQAFVADPAGQVEQLQAVEEFPNLAILGSDPRAAAPLSLPRDQARLEAGLAVLRDHFDIIVLDLPPVQGSAQTQLLSGLCDHLIYVVRWGATARSQVQAVFEQGRLAKENILGALYTQANLRRYRQYNSQDSVQYYYE